MSCPYCQSRKVSRASSLFLHLFRTALDSNKRYCAACKKRWQSRSFGGLKPRIYSAGLLAIFFLTAVAGVRFADRQGMFSGSLFAPVHSPATAGSSSPARPENLDSQRRAAKELMKRAQFLENMEKRKVRL